MVWFDRKHNPQCGGCDLLSFGMNEMSKQRKTLPALLDMVRKHAPDAALCLAGSVGIGYEVPESDIDILVFSADAVNLTFPESTVRHREAGFQFVDTTFQGVPVELLCGIPHWFENLVVSRPWRGYKFLQFEILHDPTGLILSWRDRIAPWFDDHLDVVDLYERWMTDWKQRSITRGEEQGELIRKYPEIFDLWQDLDPRFEAHVDAGPSVPSDA